MEYIIEEQKVATETGIPRDVLKKFRAEELTRDEDFALVCKSIKYSNAGLAKIRTKFSLPVEMPEKEKSPALPGKEVDGGPVQCMAVVIKTYTLNTRIMDAALPDGKTVRIRVKDNKNFVPKMEVPVRPTPNPQIWELTRPCPRWRGKW